jgi:hypothetical protein
LQTLNCNNSLDNKVAPSVETLMKAIKQLFVENGGATGEFIISGTLRNGGIVCSKMGVLHTNRGSTN